MVQLFVMMAVLSATTAPAHAQITGPNYTDLQAGLEAAQAAANRPGDASLGCEALENELVTAVNEPAVQAYIAKSGAAAQEQAAALNAARGRGATYADIRIGRYLNQFISCRDTKVQNITNTESYGCGIRVLANGTWGFASSSHVKIRFFSFAASTTRRARCLTISRAVVCAALGTRSSVARLST